MSERTRTVAQRGTEIEAEKAAGTFVRPEMLAGRAAAGQFTKMVVVDGALVKKGSLAETAAETAVVEKAAAELGHTAEAIQAPQSTVAREAALAAETDRQVADTIQADVEKDAEEQKDAEEALEGYREVQKIAVASHVITSRELDDAKAS